MFLLARWWDTSFGVQDCLLHFFQFLVAPIQVKFIALSSLLKKHCFWSITTYNFFFLKNWLSNCRNLKTLPFQKVNYLSGFGKVFRFRSWKPRVWKSRPQSWDPKSWKPCPENHILNFPSLFGSWKPGVQTPGLQKLRIPRPENHVQKISRFGSWKPTSCTSQNWNLTSWKSCP